jgi:predicted Zn finger-like uncharacterized protein
MKIECPSCRLAGNINELELPPEGSHINCPRCKNRFHVAKPAPSAKGGHMMNTCPVCQYSTFTDEMFSECPKCGATGTNYQEMLKKKAERERIKRDQEILTRSLRNPDLFVQPPVEEAAAPKPRLPGPVRITGALSVAIGAAFLICGFAGLAHYYSRDWQAVLSEPLLEPISKTRVFFRLGFLPWLRLLFGATFVAMAIQFLMLRKQAQRWLTQCAWGGVALGVINEIAEFINWVRVSSFSPSFSYYAVGAISSLFMIIPWIAPFLALIWYLQRDTILREFPESRPDALFSRLIEKIPFI